MMQFFASQWYLYWFSKQLKINRHVAQHLSTSGNDSVEINLFVWDDGHPGCWSRPAESWLWQKASTHHVTLWYSNPLSPHYPHTTPTVPCTVTTSRLYFDPKAIFQVCRHIRVQWYETLTVVTWHVLSVFLQDKTLTAYIWNMVCKLHAAQMVTLETFCKFYSSVASPIHSIHTHKRWGRHYTKRNCLLKGRGKMCSFPCRDSGILSPNVKMFDPLGQKLWGFN